MKYMPESMLIIIDMIKGFISEGPMSDASINAITPVILEQIKAFIANNEPIIAFMDTHQKDSLEFNAYPVHCLAGTSESELIKELRPFEEQMILIQKDTTNGFLQPEFLEILKQYSPLKKIIICGCCSDICVLQFALTLNTYLIHHSLPIECIVLEDGIDTFDSPGHNKKEYNQIACNLMRNANIKISNGKKELQ